MKRLLGMKMLKKIELVFDDLKFFVLLKVLIIMEGKII